MNSKRKQQKPLTLIYHLHRLGFRIRNWILCLYDNMLRAFSSFFDYLLCVIIGFFARFLLRLFGDDGLMMVEKEVEFGVGNEGKENLSVNKYESLCLNKGMNGFVEEAKARSLTVTELYFRFPLDSEDFAYMNIQQEVESVEEEFNIAMLFENDETTDELEEEELFWDWDSGNLHLESKESSFISVELRKQEEESEIGVVFESKDMSLMSSDNNKIVDDDDDDEGMILERKNKIVDQSLWEHDDVIEQLKWEIKNAPTGRLPTIMEDEEEEETTPYSQSQPIVVDKYKYKYKDRMEDIKKVYNMYAQRMKKLDIFNTQTMHAIGLIEVKEKKKDEKLKNELELVYVGHICLSWEMLTWQHRQVRELLNDVVPCQYNYNIFMTELQMFQVLIHRFLEDESFHFQASRLLNYANTRCVFRNLIQVPLLRSDDDIDCVCGTSMVDLATLDGLIIQAMFAFSQFLTKDNNNNKLGFFKLSNHFSRSKLVQRVKRDFHKKEKKVKHIARSGKCVVKRLQKKQRQILCQHLFLAEVDLRLVSRVLSMSAFTTDHLIWCQQKLNQITFSNRNLHLQSSFLLFPC